MNGCSRARSTAGTRTARMGILHPIVRRVIAEHVRTAYCCHRTHSPSFADRTESRYERNGVPARRRRGHLHRTDHNCDISSTRENRDVSPQIGLSAMMLFASPVRACMTGLAVIILSPSVARAQDTTARARDTTIVDSAAR